MKLLSLLAATLMATILSGCTLVPEPTPVSLYQLPASEITPSPKNLSFSLKVRMPETHDALASRRILVTRGGSELSAYPGTRWVSTVPALWQDHLVESFLADGRLKAVTTDKDNLQADRELSGTLRSFYADFGATPDRVVIRFDATLADTASRQVIASERFAVEEATSGTEAEAVVAAFGTAMDRLSLEILNWIDNAESNY